jgi:chromosome partitioning protein
MNARIITIANQKGGVGKTTTAVTLAHGLALKGHETLLLDLDPQGQSAVALGLNTEPGVFNVLVGRRPIKENVRFARERLALIPGDQQTAEAQMLLAYRSEGIDSLLGILKPLLRNGLQYVVIDTSPSVGGLQERALYAASLVIIPSAVDFLSADAIAQTMSTMQRNVVFGWQGGALILPTFFDETTRESRQNLADMRETYGDQVMDPIHRATVLRECAAEAKTIWEFDGASRAAQEYSGLLYRVLES